MIYLVTNQTPYLMLQLAAYACCGFIMLLAGLVAIFYISHKYSESSSPYEDKKRVEIEDEEDDKTYSLADIDYEQKKKTGKKVSFFDKILGKKKVCDECGSELVYKKSYDSYYCTDCRTFK